MFYELEQQLQTSKPVFFWNTILNNKPPESLIRTWVWMMAESNNPELVERGRKNLITAFGSMKKAIQYLESHIQATESAK